jgi:uncharacterized repeat protein (TIGR01451 family)
VQGAAAAGGPTADLSITKTVTPQTARPGQRIVYRIAVTNKGPDVADDVVVIEVGSHGARPLQVRTTRGSCRRTRPARCAIGALRPGQTVVMTAATTAGSAPSRTVNHVAVVTSTGEARLADNRAAATLVVRRPPRAPAVTG